MGSLRGRVTRRERSRRARRREGGFTLLELLMTLSVTTVGLVGLLSLHLSITRSNDAASRAAEAAQIGNGVLESLRAARKPDMVAMLTGNAADPAPLDVAFCQRDNGVVQATAVGRGGMTYRCRVVVTELTAASASLWRIRVEVGWTEDGAAQGAQGGALDHLIAVELIRTVEEAL